MAAALAAAFLFAALPARAQDSGVPLKLRFNKGDIYNYSIDITGTGEMGMRPPAGEDLDPSLFRMPLDISLFAEIEMEVRDVASSGAAKLDLFLNRFRANFGDEFYVDTDNDDDMLPPFMETLLETPVSLTVAPDGAVQKASFPKMDLEEFLLPFMPEFEMEKLLQQALFTLPEKPVAKGDTWTYDAAIELPGTPTQNVPLQYRFKMLGFEQVKGIECAVIEIVVDENAAAGLRELIIPMPYDEEAGRIAMNFERMIFNMDGKIYFAHEQGILIGLEAEMEQDVSIMATALDEPDEESIGFDMEIIADILVQLQ